MLVNNCNGEANIETLPQHIFVFDNEVFNKINVKFPLQSRKEIYPTHYTTKHPPERYLHPLPQNISSLRSVHMTKKIEGHQMTSSNHTTPFDRL